jgi:nitrile hydratase accessory protein
MRKETITSIRTALSEIQSIPRDNDEPVFSQPWQAQAFALAVSLNEQGIFTWSEWAQMFSKEIEIDGDPQSYYLNWMNALETLLNDKGIVVSEERIERNNAWDKASRATPHGEPIVLGREKHVEKNS